MKKKYNIKNRLHIATVCNQHREILEKYKIGVELDQFCMAVNMELPYESEIFRDVKNLISISTGCLLHAPFNEIFPAAIDPEARDLAFKRLRQAMKLTKKLGLEKLVVHSGYAPLIYYKEWHNDRSVEFWAELIESMAEPPTILIENVMEDEPYMMADMMERLDNEKLRLCFDVGHATCVGDVAVNEWLDVLHPYIGHFHIHNNDGTHDYHKPLFEGITDMEAVLKSAIALCDEDVSFTVECIDGLSSMEWLRCRGFI